MRFLTLVILLSFFFCNNAANDTGELYKRSKNKSSKTKSKTSRKGTDYIEANKRGQTMDEMNGVKVYYNGGVANVSGRNVTGDGYNLGLRYQCVEFVKRYYYEVYNHKMPDSYGHAKDFFDWNSTFNGSLNKARNLKQYINGNNVAPKKGDIIVFGASKQYGQYGHVAIISRVYNKGLEIIQQNVRHQTRATYRLIDDNGQFYVDDPAVLGWLRK